MNEFTELRESINSTARVARANLIFLLMLSLFLSILVSNTSDLMLLRADNIALPLMEVGIPIVWFYAIAPPVYLLININLFIRLYRLTRLIEFTRTRLGLNWSSRKEILEATVYPLDFLHLILHEGNTIRSTLLFITVLTPIYIIPLTLLIWIQLRFLPYQSTYVTLIHQLVTTAFCIITFSYSLSILHALHYDRTDSALKNFIVGYHTIPTLLTFILGVVSTLFVWLISIPPNIPETCPTEQEKGSTIQACVFDDWWSSEKCFMKSDKEKGPFRRYLTVAGDFLSNRPLLDPITLSHTLDGDDASPANTLVGTLQLSHRSFLYGIFAFSQFDRVSFRFAKLHCADLSHAKLEGADLVGVKLVGAKLTGARLNGAILKGADLSGADLRNAQINGADLSELFPGRNAIFDKTNLDGAELTRTQLNGANLRKVTMRGAYLYKTQLNGANLDLLHLEGASFGSVGTAGVENPNLKFNLIFIGGSFSGSIDHAKDGILQMKYRKSKQEVDAQLKRLDSRKEQSVKFDISEVGDRCVWPRDRLSYDQTSLPDDQCNTQLVQTACRGGNFWVGQRVAFNLLMWGNDRWVRPYLDILNNSKIDCPSISPDVRKMMCGRLELWFEEQEREGRLGTASVSNQDVFSLGRWNELKERQGRQRTCLFRHCVSRSVRACG